MGLVMYPVQHCVLEESRILLEQETWLGSCELSCGGLKGSSIGYRDPGLCKPKRGAKDTSTGDIVLVVALHPLSPLSTQESILRLQILAFRKPNAISVTCMRAVKTLTRRQHSVPAAQGEQKVLQPPTLSCQHPHPWDASVRRFPANP